MIYKFWFTYNRAPNKGTWLNELFGPKRSPDPFFLFPLNKYFKAGITVPPLVGCGLITKPFPDWVTSI